MPLIGLIVAPSFSTRRLSDSRFGLPPVTVVASTVCPVVRSKTRTLGVTISGLPSCWMVGAPCSWVTEPINRTASIGRQLKP